MKISLILSPVHSLGPGERVCLWTQGCNKRCYGCISPEKQLFTGKEVEEEKLAELIIQIALQGNSKALTISGGDPFEQSSSLLLLLKRLRHYFEDVLVYTGYDLGEVLAGNAGEEGIECLNYIDVLIDGRYVDALNTPECVLRGSSNQTIHFFNKNLKPVYGEYMKQGRILESFAHNQDTIITGIFNREKNDE